MAPAGPEQYAGWSRRASAATETARRQRMTAGGLPPECWRGPECLHCGEKVVPWILYRATLTFSAVETHLDDGPDSLTKLQSSPRKRMIINNRGAFSYPSSENSTKKF